MSQRASGYQRAEADLYPTPFWVVDALAEIVGLKGKMIWEPCCGTGEMVIALERCGADVMGTDLHDRSFPGMLGVHDFTNASTPACVNLKFLDGIVTNPPYGERMTLAEAFIRRSLDITGTRGFVAMLLPVDFDSASRRAWAFAECPRYAGKVVLTKRIKWFDGPASPSVSHAWFLWDRQPLAGRLHPRIWYAPRAAA